jgi:DNA-binding NarL/FixJ family response regulator
MIRTLVLADDPLARSGLNTLLMHAPAIAVVGQAGSDADLDAMLAAFQPDAILWDLGWTPDGQIVALNQFVEEHTLPVVLLLAVNSLVDMVRAAGACGLLPRTSRASQMAAALHVVTQGLLVFDATLQPAPAPSPARWRSARIRSSSMSTLSSVSWVRRAGQRLSCAPHAPG